MKNEKATGNIGMVLLGVLISFFPKCAFCWAAYMSIFSTFGIASVPYMPWLQSVLIVLFFVNGYTTFVVARRAKSYAPFVMSALGAVVILLSKYATISLLTYLGLALIISGSLWNLLTKKLACKV